MCTQPRQRRMILHASPLLLYIKALTCVYLFSMIVPLTVAQLVDASFNDTRCEDGGTVCPTDPLLFTCIVNNSPIPDITVTFPSGHEIQLHVTNMTEGDLPDGVHVKSHNVTVDGTFDYALTLSIESASLLNGGEITCDTNALDNEDNASCPVAGTPGSPLSLTFDASANRVFSAVIRWDSPSSTGGSEISIMEYRITSRDSGLHLNVTVDDKTYDITGIQYNTEYSVEVTAINSCGLESAPASVVVNIEARLEVPPMPTLLSPVLYCDVLLKDSTPVVINWMYGDELEGVVYPGAVEASVVLDPGDIDCIDVSTGSTSCTAFIPGAVYTTSLTLTNDVGSAQPVTHTFDLNVLKVEEVNAMSVNLTLNPFCHRDVTYRAQVFFGVRQDSDDECIPQQNIAADIMAGESVILTVDASTLRLDPGQEYCITNTTVNIGSPHNEGSDSTTDGLSAGAAAGIAVALTLLVTLPVGVVIGYFGTRWQRRGPRGQGTQQKQKQEQLELDKPIYEELGTGPVETAITLSENQAYGQVNMQKN